MNSLLHPSRFEQACSLPPRLPRSARGLFAAFVALIVILTAPSVSQSQSVNQAQLDVSRAPELSVEPGPTLAALALERATAQQQPQGFFQRLMTQDYCGARSTDDGLLATRSSSNGCAMAADRDLLAALAVRYQQDVESQRLAATRARRQSSELAAERLQLTAQIESLRAQLERVEQQRAAEVAQLTQTSQQLWVATAV